MKCFRRELSFSHVPITYIGRSFSSIVGEFDAKVTSEQWRNKNVQKKFIGRLGKALGFKKTEDWYQITSQQIISHGGAGLLRVFERSRIKMLVNLFPDFDWQPWKFAVAPRNFWKSMENQRRYLEWLGKQLGYTNMEDWYHTKQTDFHQFHGIGLLETYDNSPVKAITTIFAEYEWQPWRFDSVSKGFWRDPKNLRLYFDWLGKKLGFKTYEDWYQLKQSDITSNGGNGVSAVLNSSPSKALQTVYPEYKWELKKFRVKPVNFWSDMQNQRDFMEDLGRKLGYTEMHDWYSLKLADIENNDGARLLTIHDFSVFKILSRIFPDYDWEFWKFDKVPMGAWKDPKNQRKYLDWLGKRLDIKEPSDWYRVSQIDFQVNRGAELLQLYDFSPIKAVSSIYSEYDWKIWKFDRVPANTWQNEKNIKDFVKELEEKLKVKHWQEWYRVSAEQVAEAGGYSAMKTYKGLGRMLQHVYPEYNWDLNLFNRRSKKSSQRWLRLQVSELFPDQELLEDYFHPELRSGLSGESLELDIYLPNLALAFEYQGPQHYKDSFVFGSLDSYKERDKEKKTVCEKAGITLIDVPYWWDKSIQSLKATIKAVRPGLIKDVVLAAPIPDQPPVKQQVITPVMMAEEYIESIDPTNWWISEKYDGIRAYWDGETLRSKHGRKFDAVPAFFTKDFPNVRLDGELWAGRGAYEDVFRVLSTRGGEVDLAVWRQLKFMVFDQIDEYLPFEERMKNLKEILGNTTNPYIQLIQPIKCGGKDHLKEFKNEIIKKGGEGVILRRPNSRYELKRSSDFLKLKPYKDTEVRFLEVKPQSNGLLCEQLNGVQCTVQCPGVVLTNPPPSGSVITVKYEGYHASKKLKYPTYVKTCPDVNWKDLKMQT